MSLLLARPLSALSVTRHPSGIASTCVKSTVRGAVTSTREQLALAESLRIKAKRLQEDTPVGENASGKTVRLRTERNRVAFRALNKNDGNTLIDLHGMDVKGAKDKALQKEAWAKKIHQKTLRFIVGHGKHSDGPSALKGSVRELLRKRNHKVATINGGGVLLVKLKS